MWLDMTAKVFTSIPLGFDGCIVEVECSITQGLPQFDIVGMANKTVSEARQRVRNAIKNAGLKWPDSHITINLAPAELAKDGNFFDLPIAVCILLESKQLLPSDVANSIFSGELSLDGQIRPIRGVINILEAGQRAGFRTFYLPSKNLTQATLIPDLSVCGATSLLELIQILKQQISPQTPPNLDVVKNNKTDRNELLLDQIYGQELAKKALIVAIAGHHNLLLSGPPGAGKTLLAHAAATLLPDLTAAEMIDTTKLHSLAGLTDTAIYSRPFRSPHSSSTLISFIGGGNSVRPGEISLANNGILFLDELPEYRREVLESLRQPLEDRQISLARANTRYTYPSDFILIATMNPCPCGFLGDPTKTCTCSKSQIEKYRHKLSGPLLDRIDLRINVPKVDTKLLCSQILSNQHNAQKIASAVQHQAVVKNNITEAIARQTARYGTSTKSNASLSSAEVIKYLTLAPAAKSALEHAAESLSLSARSYFKLIKVARTIADLAGENLILSEHIFEALSYRMDI